MRRSSIIGLGCLALVAVGYAASMPKFVAPEALVARSANGANGEYVFNAAGCANCHATTGQDDRLRLGGGYAVKSPFGDFKVPNISSHKTLGIGAWTELQFVTAMRYGVGREGQHLFPSFPYTAYQHMTLDDMRDLFAYLTTVPQDGKPSEPHSLPFPFNVRRAVGLWKQLFFDRQSQPKDARGTPEIERGAYLVEAMAHCAECHSGRNPLGAVIPAKRFAGGAEPGSTAWVPNITPHADGLAAWSLRDIEFLLETGFTPDGVPVGASMGAVIRSTAKLTASDRKAMAAYLKALPPRPGKKPAKP